MKLSLNSFSYVYRSFEYSWLFLLSYLFLIDLLEYFLYSVSVLCWLHVAIAYPFVFLAMYFEKQISNLNTIKFVNLYG